MKASFGGRVNVVKDLVVKGALIDLKCRVHCALHNFFMK